jgi:hypothetical protein
MFRSNTDAILWFAYSRLSVLELHKFSSFDYENKEKKN